MKMLITAGPTVEPIDPVRYLSNHSSGKMGYAIADAAVQEEVDEVILISGPTALDIPSGVTFIGIQTAKELEEAVREYLPQCDVGVFTAAVSDFRVKAVASQKIKKQEGEDEMTLHLVKNPDILGQARTYFDGLLIGFAAETENVLDNAKAKLVRKGCDLIVANDVSRDDIGFGADENQVTLVYKDDVVALDQMSKEDLGLQIVFAAKELFRDRET